MSTSTSTEFPIEASKLSYLDTYATGSRPPRGEPGAGHSTRSLCSSNIHKNCRHAGKCAGSMNWPPDMPGAQIKINPESPIFGCQVPESGLRFALCAQIVFLSVLREGGTHRQRVFSPSIFQRSCGIMEDEVRVMRTMSAGSKATERKISLLLVLTFIFLFFSKYERRKA